VDEVSGGSERGGEAINEGGIREWWVVEGGGGEGVGEERGVEGEERERIAWGGGDNGVLGGREGGWK